MGSLASKILRTTEVRKEGKGEEGIKGINDGRKNTIKREKGQYAFIAGLIGEMHCACQCPMRL